MAWAAYLFHTGSRICWAAVAAVVLSQGAASSCRRPPPQSSRNSRRLRRHLFSLRVVAVVIWPPNEPVGVAAVCVLEDRPYDPRDSFSLF